MSISPFFSGKSENVVDLHANNSTLASAHQSLNVSSPNVSPINGASVAPGGLGLPSMGNENASTNFYSPNDLFLSSSTVDSFKISSVNGSSELGMPEEELGSLYDFKSENQNGNPPFHLSGSASSTSNLFRQALEGSRLLEAERNASERAAGGLDYADIQNNSKPRYLLGPSAKEGKRNGLEDASSEGDQEHTMLAKKIFEGRRDEPTIDAELAAIGIKGIPTIHTACVDGNLKLVKRLTEVRNADIEAKDILGSRPLHVASCYGRLDIIRFLMGKGADVNATDNYKSTPLVVTSHPETVKLLVSFGANINAKNVNSISAKSISLSNPYVCLAIEQGQKLLQQRIKKTRNYIGVVLPKFLDPKLCRGSWNWSWVVKNRSRASSSSTTHATPHKEDNKPSISNNDDNSNANTPTEPPRKRKRLDDGSGRKAMDVATHTQNNGSANSNPTSMDVQREEAGGRDQSTPGCLADLVVAFLYHDDDH